MLGQTAQAAPITFGSVTGYVTITLDVNGVRGADPITVGVDGVSATLDPIAGSVLSMNLTTAGAGVVTLDAGTPAYADGVREVVLHSAEFLATNGLLAPVNPPTEHFFLFSDGIGSTQQIDTVFSALGPGGIPIIVNQPFSFNPDNTSGTVNGEIAPGALISVDGITLGQFTSPISGASVVVKGDIVFTAENLVPGSNPIPEPASAVLLGAGALLVGYSLRRQLNEN